MPLALYGAILLISPAIIALLISFVLPSLDRARELSARTTCGRNLVIYGRSVTLSPPDTTESTSTAPAGCPNAKQFNYILVKRPVKMLLDPGDVIAYEPLDNHSDGGNVLFADGHVDWLTLEEYEKIIKPLQAATTMSWK